MGGKITISTAEVYAPEIDHRLQAQETASRVGAHYQAQSDVPPVPFAKATAHTGVQNPVLYAALWGAAFGLVAWIVAEPSQLLMEWQLADIVRDPQKYTQSDIDSLHTRFRLLNCFWTLCFGGTVAAGMSGMYSLLSMNWLGFLRTAAIGLVLGGMLAVVAGFLANQAYAALQGGAMTTSMLQQVLARTVGWGLIGASFSLAPALVLRSGKRFLLGLAGGAIGGLLGGIVFDFIGRTVSSGWLSRLVGIVSIATISSLATGLFENLAKTGWLLVRGGMIAGKQFILYRNPTTIGSSPQCQIYLFKDALVAPQHAAIHMLPDGFEIEAGTGGTVYLNGRAVVRQRLRSGDEVQIGSTTFAFQERQEEERLTLQ